MNIRNYLIFLLLFPVSLFAQTHTDLQERALNGQIKTIFQYDYKEKLNQKIDLKISADEPWFRKIIYHYDSVGNLEKKEAYVKSELNADSVSIATISIFKNVNGNFFGETFDEKDHLLWRTTVINTSDTSYTVQYKQPKSNFISYEIEETLNKNFRDLGGKSSAYMENDGIRQLVKTNTYTNTIDHDGRLLSSVDVDSETFARTTTNYKYLQFDVLNNPTKIIQYQNNLPILINTRTYDYYK